MRAWADDRHRREPRAFAAWPRNSRARIPANCSPPPACIRTTPTEYTAECDAEMRALQALPEVVAVGECGLDYFRDFSPRPAQRRAFEMQLQIAADTGKPLFLHQRDAHADFMARCSNFDGRLGPAVVHCFTGTREELFDYLDQDWYVGITGWLCDERRGLHLRELVKHIPANRLMIETDAPYLLPRTVSRNLASAQRADVPGAHRGELARDRGEAVATSRPHDAAATRSSACRLGDVGRAPLLRLRTRDLLADATSARPRGSAASSGPATARRVGDRPAFARCRRRPARRCRTRRPCRCVVEVGVTRARIELHHRHSFCMSACTSPHRVHAGDRVEAQIATRPSTRMS
jgi:TatD DNase family protein